ncbi:MAG: NusG domain II-containing protein [Clostridia bacterium]|nr:NusG domain II-containing protein [Clostridia bacterium]
MKKKNLIILGVVGAVILILALLSVLLPRTRTIVVDDATPTLDPIVTPAVTPLTVTTPEGEVLTPSPLPEADAPAETPIPTVSATDTPTETPEPEAQPEATNTPEVRAYLVVTVDDRTYQPIALTQEGDYTIRQAAKGAVNVVHVTPESITMASSTCDNQNCVGEGEVTLDNMDSRILGRYIICLPNGVTLELYSREEMEQALIQQMQNAAMGQ